VPGGSIDEEQHARTTLEPALIVDAHQHFSDFKAIVADLRESQQRALFHDNAVRIYRLSNLD
jgi:hypothetical protein